MKENTKKLIISIAPELKEKLDLFTEKNGGSATTVTVIALAEFLKKFQ